MAICPLLSSSPFLNHYYPSPASFLTTISSTHNALLVFHQLARVSPILGLLYQLFLKYTLPKMYMVTSFQTLFSSLFGLISPVTHYLLVYYNISDLCLCVQTVSLTKDYILQGIFVIFAHRYIPRTHNSACNLEDTQ